MRFIPNVKLGKNVGFCTGVRNTIDFAYSLLEKNKPLFATGELIHNPSVMSELYSRGLIVIDWNSIPKKQKVLIQAHGLNPRDNEMLLLNKNEVIDSTCPIVKKSFESIKKLSETNQVNLVYGSTKHPEMLALDGYVDNLFIFDKFENLDPLLDKLQSSNSVCISAQTTKAYDEFSLICNKLSSYVKNTGVININNTICKFTVERENEVNEESKNSDVVIIIGGKNSSNTSKLYKIAKNNCNNSFHIEKKEEIHYFENIIKQAESVFISSGTSTPIKQVNEIYEYILQIVGG